MRSLENACEEVEEFLLKGETVDSLMLAIQLQRNDVLADIEEKLETINPDISDVVKKLDEISFNIFNTVNQ
jgi:hypothetical protein